VGHRRKIPSCSC